MIRIAAGCLILSVGALISLPVVAQQPAEADYRQYQQAPEHYGAAANCPAGTCGPHCTGHGHSSCWTSFYRNTRWPLPFVAQDVNAVTSYFDAQRENGWRLRNTLGNALFDPATQCLTEAGKNHIRSILHDNPSDRRVVFVLHGQNPKQTAKRVESTQLAISEIIPVGDLPPIYLTDRDAPGSSGAYQTAVMRAMMTSMPAPRLPAVNNLSGGGVSP